MSSRAQVYVFEADGVVKVGISKNPAKRSGEVGLRGVRLVYASDPIANARDAERSAHCRLDDHRIEGEWFDVTPEEAIRAVKEAMAAVELRNNPPTPEEAVARYSAKYGSSTNALRFLIEKRPELVEVLENSVTEMAAERAAQKYG